MMHAADVHDRRDDQRREKQKIEQRTWHGPSFVRLHAIEDGNLRAATRKQWFARKCCEISSVGEKRLRGFANFSTSWRKNTRRLRCAELRAHHGKARVGAYTCPVRWCAAAFVLLLVIAFAQVPAGQHPRDLRPTVILISFDGWRWDYDAKFPAPNVRRVIARGVRAAALIPSFPPKTFPNHYTIVTGLYPGHHGVIANNIYDPQTGRRFSISNRARSARPDVVGWRADLGASSECGSAGCDDVLARVRSTDSRPAPEVLGAVRRVHAGKRTRRPCAWMARSARVPSARRF